MEFVSESEADYYVICGRDEDYETMAKEILSSINNDEQIVDLAGRLNADLMNELRSAGLNGNIYLGQDMVQKLDTLLSRWEAGPNGK